MDKTRSKEMSQTGKTNTVDDFVNRFESKSDTLDHVNTIGVKELMNDLNEDQRFIIEYIYFKGYTYSEVSEEFDIPLRTVKSRVRAAIQVLTKTMSFTSTRIVSYFLRGLLFLTPITVTIYIIYQKIIFLDNLIPVPIPGIGILMVLALITFFGYLASLFFAKPFFEWMERGLIKIPLVNLIYGSIKDLMGAFVGDKKKFSSPVIVQISEHLSRLGFITQEDMSVIGLPDLVAVYFPHSYNVSGNVFLVPKEKVKTLTGVKSSDVMKFMVSGGVSNLE